jgi:hypothetical protein
VADRAEDVVVAPAVRGQRFVGVGVIVFGIDAEIAVRAKTRIGSKLART